MLELRAVSKAFAGPDGETIRAVDRVSLTVAAGELVALYGPSGSGKSTLLFLAAGIAQPDAGAVLFDGHDLASLSRRAAARHRRTELGFVFQSTRLVPGLSAIDNAALKLMAEGATRTEARRRVAPLLERLGVVARAEHRATQLSRGERHRVALARALSNDPRLVLADEPTGSLDSQRSQEVLALLAEVCRERAIAVVLVTHDPAGAAVADRVQRLRDGRLTETTGAVAPVAAPQLR
ncbi:MAG: ABC transporter ATP-binding protein [Actinobacteria bacterium]|nr:ABC transporter ATP-binding protein [Actinomycetota bacterium]